MSTGSRAFADEVEKATEQFGHADHPDYGNVWAYEVDGFGGRVLMDDAGAPGLLSLPYLGATGLSDPRYLRTRRFVLSAANPYFVSGRAGSGIGSPHTGFGKIWPLSLLYQAMTSTSDAEIRSCLHALVNASAGTGFMHESFDKDDVGNFTRPWFAWCNSLFGELIIKLKQERPQLLTGFRANQG